MNAQAQDPREPQESVAEFWETVASDGDQASYVSIDWPPVVSTRRFQGELRQVERWISSLASKQRCLDFGCGSGQWIEGLAPHFESIEGIDYSQGMADVAADRIAERNIENATARCASYSELPTEPTYDLIFVGGVLMYLDGEAFTKAIKRLRMAVKPGGLVIFRESTHRKGTWRRSKPLSPGLFSAPDAPRAPYHAIYRPTTELASVLKSSGFATRTSYNKHYKVADVTEEQLRFVNKLVKGKLSRDRDAADRWARRIQWFRWLTISPAIALRRLGLPMWKVDNHWFVCRPKTTEPVEQFQK